MFFLSYNLVLCSPFDMLWFCALDPGCRPIEHVILGVNESLREKDENDNEEEEELEEDEGAGSSLEDPNTVEIEGQPSSSIFLCMLNTHIRGSRKSSTSPNLDGYEPDVKGDAGEETMEPTKD
ncbi:hypothetical protein F5880DRAFT_1508523 [Lentinula raphanica]|nr:hypothetical protein F5880DRAFT_1508523 [Lentinula raphanica]